jgi:hypothetical protein
MDKNRRTALRAAVAAALLPLAAPALAAGAPARSAAPASAINVILPRSVRPDLDGAAGRRRQERLTLAVMDFVREHYQGRNLPVWRKPATAIDLHKRVANICLWVVRSCHAHREVYPVDPAWVAGQIMAESFFNEFAVSWALAVGICQFIGPTAREYGLAVAGSAPGHGAAPYKNPADAGAEAEYLAVRRQWREALRERRRLGDEGELLRAAMRAHVDGAPCPQAGPYLEASRAVDELDAKVKDARQRFTAYLEANFAGRSIFDPGDVAFFKGFDERVLYAKPVDAMVLMLARFLRARGGNILAAAAGYHAGLGNTSEDAGVYKRYGRIPAFADTVGYVSRCLVNHHEIALRMA